MKAFRTVLALLLTITMLTATAGADILDLLPKPTDSTDSSTLPNFGSVSGTVGELSSTSFSYNGKVWDVWYYPMTGNWGNDVDGWLSACKAAGFGWQISSYDNRIGYLVEVNTYQAILIPNANERILLLVEHGLQMAEEVIEEEAALKLYDVRITYNGKKFETKINKTYPNEYGFYWDASASLYKTELNWVSIRIPYNVQTGTTAHFTKGSSIKDTKYFLSILSGGNFLFNGASFGASHKMTSSKDYFDVTIYYRGSSEIIGVYEGSFNDGKDVVKVEFYLPI